MYQTLNNIEPLFDNLEDFILEFKKETYPDAFYNYMEINKAYFDELNDTLRMEERKSDSNFKDDYAGMVIGYIVEKLQSAEENRKIDLIQTTYNMFTTIYFLPAILEEKQPGSESLADLICVKWSERIKGQALRSADFETILSGFRLKLCYITTAVCKSLQKPENCYELELLRDYRDHYLLQDGEEGKALVEKYYDIAPTIVKRINKSADAGEIYRYIWENFLKPCVNAIENRNLEDCKAIYIDMVEELQKQYMATGQWKADGIKYE